MINKLIDKLRKKKQTEVIDFRPEAYVNAFVHLSGIPVVIKKIEQKGTIVNIICDQPQLLIGPQGSLVKNLSAGLSKYLNEGVGVNIEKF